MNAFDHTFTKADALYKNIYELSIVRATPTSVVFVAPVKLVCEICRVNEHVGNDCQMILTGGSAQENINYLNN